MGKKKTIKKNPVIEDIDRIIHDDKLAFRAATQVKTKPFDIGEHKDDKRYVEYPDNGKITRKYKDNCKLTYTRDSAGKAINLKWITYKH